MKKKIKLLINLFIGIMVPVQWLIMVFSLHDSILVSTGLGSLKYFTVLSNWLEAIACWLYIFTGNDRLKYAGSTSVILTFTVVMTFLGPIFGYPFMFRGVNFWFHLLIPLLAALEFVVFNKESCSRKDSCLATLPMFIYGIVYVVNILINGLDGNDWYYFMAWGYPMGFAIFFIILFVTWLLAIILKTIRNRIQKQGR